MENNALGKQKNYGVRRVWEGKQLKWKADPKPFHVSRSGLKLGHKAIIVSPSANHRWATRKIILGYGVIKMCHGEAYICMYIYIYLLIIPSELGYCGWVGGVQSRSNQDGTKAMERVRIDGCSIHKPTTDDLVTELQASGHEGYKGRSLGKTTCKTPESSEPLMLPDTILSQFRLHRSTFQQPSWCYPLIFSSVFKVNVYRLRLSMKILYAFLISHIWPYVRPIVVSHISKFR